MMQTKPPLKLLNKRTFRWIWALAILHWASCNSAPSMQPITIAFPNPNVGTADAVHLFQAILEDNSQHMIQNTRIEGLPSDEVVINLDRSKMAAYGLRTSEVMSAIEAELPSLTNQVLNVEEVEELAMDFKVDRPLEDITRIVVGRKGEEAEVRLGDIANVMLQKRFHSVMVRGLPCIVIKGTTSATEAEAKAWLTGLDQHLQVKFFIIFGE